MRYDLDLLNEFCHEIDVPAQVIDGVRLEVPVGDGAVLCFQNSDREEDCLLGFIDTPWHTHGDLLFADPRGHCVELDSLNLLSGLKQRKVLVCEQQIAGRITDRWLIHSEYNDEFRYIQPGERIVVRPAAFAQVGTT
jgi:hypothetical protein